MIQLGAAWKFIELPSAIDPEKPIVAIVSGIRSLLFDKDNDAQPRDEAVDAALKALADYDIKNAAVASGWPARKDRAVPRRPRAALACRGEGVEEPDEQLAYQQASRRQPGRRPPHRPLSARKEAARSQIIADGGKLGSYAAYCMIDAEFAMNNEAPDANVLANQKKWMADLDDFLKKFPNSDEVPAVLLHLANANEFNAEEKTAREQYGKLVQDYAAYRRRQEGRRVHCGGSTWPDSRSRSRAPDCKTRRSTRRSISASQCSSSSGRAGPRRSRPTCPT